MQAAKTATANLKRSSTELVAIDPFAGVNSEKKLRTEEQQ